jgi:hypothetical protein
MISKTANLYTNGLRFASYFVVYIIHLQLLFEILFLFLLTLKQVKQIVENAMQSAESQHGVISHKAALLNHICQNLKSYNRVNIIPSLDNVTVTNSRKCAQ